MVISKCCQFCHLHDNGIEVLSVLSHAWYGVIGVLSVLSHTLWCYQSVVGPATRMLLCHRSVVGPATRMLLCHRSVVGPATRMLLCHRSVVGPATRMLLCHRSVVSPATCMLLYYRSVVTSVMWRYHIQCSIDWQLCDGVNVLRVVFVTYMTSCCGDVFSVLSHISHGVIVLLKRLCHLLWCEGILIFDSQYFWWSKRWRECLSIRHNGR